MTPALQGFELAGRELQLAAVRPEPFPLRAVEPSPCAAACPAGINVKAYVSLIAEGRFAQALEVVRERCPLPGVCGRVCHHPCEAACRRGEIDQPIAIRSLKRFVADLELELPEPPPPPPVSHTESVAVVGSGPAGLTAAYDLRRAGYPVTVFEAEPEAGGMLRYGIADYRLPPEVLDREIEVLEASGIEIVTGCRIGRGRSLADLLSAGFDAALLALGAQRGRGLGIEGEPDAPAVEDALAFLRRVNRGERAPVRGRVLVIGGGSTAIEAARAARRLGAESVEIVYRRDRGEMPADGEEIELAQAEGISLRLLTAPSRIRTADGRLDGLECREVALGAPDAGGRRRPIPIPGTEHLVSADRIFAAVGQEAELDLLSSRIRDRVAPRGRIEVDPATGMTALRGVFAAGDVASGPATVIDAIAAGHRSAGRILRFLAGHGPKAEEPLAGCEELEIPAPPPAAEARRCPPYRSLRAGREFAEVELAYSPALAVEEARRCLRCGPCAECRICAASCRRRHLSLRAAGDPAGRPALLVRASAALASAVAQAGVAGSELDARLLPAGERPRHRTAPPGCGEAVRVGAARVSLDPELCRGCARCLEVCAFDALTAVDSGPRAPSVRLQPALCRGCALCAAICPTGALTPTAALSVPEILSSRPTAAPRAILACRRRAAALQERLASLGLGEPETRLVAVRCAGQLDAGTLLELYRHGAGQVLVAGCLAGSCRYGFGSGLAAEQIRRARAVLENLGLDPGHVVADWAGGGEPELPLPQPVRPDGGGFPSTTSAAGPSEGA